MRSIAKLFAAFSTLTDSVLSLASVLDTTTARLRMQLASETEPPVIEHHGEVIDTTPETPATKRNGRAKATA